MAGTSPEGGDVVAWRGAQGATGPQGATGAQGATGPQGNTGPQGAGDMPPPTGKQPSMSRVDATGALNAYTGYIFLAYFYASGGTYGSIAFYSDSVPAAPTPGLIKFGVYEVAANGDLTLVAETANNTAIFAIASTKYAEALLAAFVAAPGQLYAMALLVVTAAANPTVVGRLLSGSPSALFGEYPPICTFIPGQIDLPGTIDHTLVVEYNGLFFGVLEP